MSNIDSVILKEFVDDSKGLITSAIELLESIETDFSKVQMLQRYVNQMDHIMGVAKNLALLVPKNHPLVLICDYTALCKSVGYKASQISDNADFYYVCVALLLDATETLNVLISNMDRTVEQLKKNISSTFIDRLRWVSHQFNENFQASAPLDRQPLKQDEIDVLMKKLGV
ncbi:MAG: hypothetical protein V4736_14505 [Bdellovibrionota bacterium]